MVVNKNNKVISKKTNIYIAGHKRMIGTAALQILDSKGYSNLICKKNK
jgi:hypothetical protein